MEEKKVVVISGGFDPIHVGHIRMIHEAAELGDELIVIVNNDNWLRKKKGFAFIDEGERMEIVKAIKGVDKVALSEHGPNPTDMSVCAELEKIKPDIFANGGDRTDKNIPEIPVCEKIGCKMVFGVGVGGKVQASSDLLRRYADFLKRKEKGE
ncbi:MAG: adenylyltransferase/cytidyltransferase family protein [Candidatus Paceibacterota bacterium]